MENHFFCIFFSHSDGERLSIELGRALRPGEYKCKLYHMKLSDMVDDYEKITFLCEWILCKGASVEKTKRDILAHITKIDPKYDISYDCARLRRKTGKTPAQIYVDNEIFGEEIVIGSISEVMALHQFLHLTNNQTMFHPF